MKYSKRSTKKGGECERNCRIVQGCTGPRRYNPETNSCEMKLFQGGAKSHDEYAIRKILEKNPTFTKIKPNHIPINAQDPKYDKNYNMFIQAYQTAQQQKMDIKKAKMNVYTDPTYGYNYNVTGGKKRRSARRSKKSKKSTKRRRH